MELDILTESVRSQIEVARTLDAIIVLGGEGRDHSRSDHAYQLHNRIERQSPLFLVLTGGQNEKQGRPAGLAESEQMRNYLLSGGVADDVIRTKTVSREMLGNIVYAQPILKDLGAKRVGIITDPSYMSRAMWTAKRVLGNGKIRELPTNVPTTVRAKTKEQVVKRAHQFDLWRMGIAPADQAGFERYLQEMHPSYNPNAPMSAYKLGVALFKTA